MHPENSIRTNEDLVEEESLIDIFRKVPDLSTWSDEGLGVLKYSNPEVTVWYQPLKFAVSTEIDTEDMATLYRLAFGIEVEGVNLEFLAEGGYSTVYKFRLNEKPLVVKYIQYVDVLSGMDRLESTTLLREEGCQVNKSLFATNRAIIDELVTSQRDLLQEEKEDYMKLMKQGINVLIKARIRLEKRGLWKPWWRIDWNNRNNFIPIFDSQDNLVSVCNIDPVALNRSAWL